jgi:hypothetical protein
MDETISVLSSKVDDACGQILWVSIDFGLCPGSSTSRLGNQAQKIPSRKPAARKAWASKAALTSWDEVAFKLWQGWDEEVG